MAKPTTLRHPVKLGRWTFWLAWLALGGNGAAHNLDTSYARVLIDSNRVELRLTFDLFTLFSLTDLDPDRDQRVSLEEFRGAIPPITNYLRGAVLLEINGQPMDLGTALEPAWPSTTGEAVPASEWHSVNGLVIFPFEQSFTGDVKTLALGFDFFPTFGPRHTVLGVFVRGNRTHEVTFSQHQPDYIYDVPGEDLGIRPDEAAGAVRRESIGSALSRFLMLGIEHILLGYDHICFLIALVVVSRLGELVKIVTSFTVAHSITLILAALNLVRLPERLIECGIALTIVYVAIENLWVKKTSHRWVLTFFFGLVHGFGFANVLAALHLPPVGTIRCLLAFNVGVELGQLALVLLLLPVTWALSKWRLGHRVLIGLSVLIGGLGLGWFTERVFRISFMPF